MRNWLLIALLFATCAAWAQGTNAPPTNAPSGAASHSFQAQGPVPAQESVVALRQPKPNEIVQGPITYTGALVEVVKSRRPLQLINPLAPPEYGSPEDNVVREPIHRRVVGLKLFAIRF